MSFKDDFFEALRSVKRDFFRQPDPGIGSESEEPRQTGSAQEPEFAQIFRPHTEDASAHEVSSPAQSGPEVMEAFKQASIFGDDLSDDNTDDDTGAVHTANSAKQYDVPSFRSFEPPEGFENYPDISSLPSSGDSRKIYDFDPDDLYSDDKTIISRNTVIRGELHTDDSLRLLGQILGDIECKSNIVVAGKVRGNTTAANAYIVDAQIDGNMFCDDAVNINKDAWVLGNIRAQQADIDGKVKGNIEIRHGVSIGPDSSVIGNISTDELEVKRGAFVNGQIIMYSPSRDVIDRFEDFDR